MGGTSGCFSGGGSPKTGTRLRRPACSTPSSASCWSGGASTSTGSTRGASAYRGTLAAWRPVPQRMEGAHDARPATSPHRTRWDFNPPRTITGRLPGRCSLADPLRLGPHRLFGALAELVVGHGLLRGAQRPQEAERVLDLPV